MKIIAGSSNLSFAQSLSQKLKLELIEVKFNKFANDEKRIKILGKAQGEDIILVQSFSTPVDEHIIEFLLLADALERMGAKEVSAVIPWYGYSLQDKVFTNGEPLSAKVVADLVSHSYAQRVFILDVHNTSVAGFFSVPTQHLSAINLFTKYVRQNFELSKAIVASPDFGGLKRAAQMAQILDLDLANIEKSRNLKTGEITMMELHGDVKDKIVLVFDDVIVSGGTVIEATQVLKNAGAKEVHFFATHGILVNNSAQKLTSSSLDSITITNSITQSNLPNKIKIIDCSNLFAEAII